MTPRAVHDMCVIDAESEQLLRAAIQRLGMSARACHPVLRLTARSRTSRERIESARCIAEAIQYRSLDRRGPGAIG